MAHNLFVPVENADTQVSQNNYDSEDSISFYENSFAELVEPRLDVTPVAYRKLSKQAVAGGLSELSYRNGLDRPGSNVETDMEKIHSLPTTDDKEKQLSVSAQVVIAQPNEGHHNGR